MEEEKKEKLKRQLEESIMKGVITTFCWWPKYTQEAYLMPNIRDDFRYGWRKGHVHIFPKPTFLPNQIHIRKPEDIKNIPEGIYPQIRCHHYGGDRVVFAISPDTEVVFHDSRAFKEVEEGVYAKPLEMYGLDLIVIWNGTIKRYNIVDFNKKWDNPKHRPTYWEGVYEGLSMYYLPEVIFRRLMDEKIEPKQEPFINEIVNEIINGIDADVSHREYEEWLQPIVDRYKNIPINDDLPIVGFLDLHKMPGAWFVRKVERKIDGDYKNNAMYIVNMKEPNQIFRVGLPWQIPKITNSWEPTFITVWPDGTIGWWDIITFGISFE
jgi:hypothetical protein